METITFALASAACLLGLAAGPVATALVQQVPHGRPKRLTPVCAGCGAARTLPLVALAPRLGRCRRCGSRAPAVEWVAELSLAVLWALVAFRLSPTHPWAVPTYLAFTFACVVLAVIDARTRLLPNRLTYPAFVVTTIGLALTSLVEGDPGRLSRGLIAAAAVGCVFLLLAAVSHDAARHHQRRRHRADRPARVPPRPQVEHPLRPLPRARGAAGDPHRGPHRRLSTAPARHPRSVHAAGCR
jgi:prepilin signal peptidase PulO-like enzyme (type II secretory pathway)